MSKVHCEGCGEDTPSYETTPTTVQQMECVGSSAVVASMQK